jgi:sugar phosphate isomerase/epimerase
MSLGSAFDYHTPDQTKLRKDIEATKEYITLAHDVGATGVKVRPNGLPKDVPEEKTLEQIGRSLHELGEFGANFGQQIRLEIHGSETSRVSRCKQIMDVADHRMVGVCWNSNPSDLEDGVPLPAALHAAQRDQLHRLHLRGDSRQPGPGARDEILPQPVAGVSGAAVIRLPHTPTRDLTLTLARIP